MSSSSEPRRQRTRRQLVDDLIHDILLRLLVKDLLRFRCLSKSVCTTIGSAAFIADHKAKTRRKLIFRFGTKGSATPEYKCAGLDDGDIHSAVKLHNPSEPAANGRNQIIGSCNGLVLLYDMDKTIYIWNPFTRRVKKVPWFGSYCKFPPRKDVARHLRIGFGYDSSSKHYKVVTIQKTINYGLAVRVFDVASNTWTSQVVQNPFGKALSYFFVEDVGVFANGALHWLGRAVGQAVVLSFDIANNVFVNLFPPISVTLLFPSHSRYHLPPFSLQVLEGRIRAVLGKLDGKIVELREAVGDGDGDGDGLLTWRKLYDIDMKPLNEMIGGSEIRKPSMFVKLFKYSKDGGKILLLYNFGGYVDNTGNFFLVRPSTGSFEPAHIVESGNFYEATVCEETLVSI